MFGVRKLFQVNVQKKNNFGWDDVYSSSQNCGPFISGPFGVLRSITQEEWEMYQFELACPILPVFGKDLF